MGVTASEREEKKNTFQTCDPFVQGPALAIDTVKGLSCLEKKKKSVKYSTYIHTYIHTYTHTNTYSTYVHLLIK